MSFLERTSVRTSRARNGRQRVLSEEQEGSRKRLAGGEEKMKSPETKEIVKRLVVLLLFMLFGFCVPGYAATKEIAAAGRSGS